MTKADLRAIKDRYLRRLSALFPPALRVLAHVEPPANDQPWDPVAA